MLKILLTCLLVTPAFAATKPDSTKLKDLKKKIRPTAQFAKKTLKSDSKSSGTPAHPLEAFYLRKSKDPKFLGELKKRTLKYKHKAVPTLVKVMKGNHFPEESRWIATFMLGRIMGKKSADFISKFTSHPNWMLRLASLKVLLHLEQRQYKGLYARMLDDNSLIVRHQALQNISQMKIVELAPFVWKMLYNKNNYVGQKGERKRSNIIADAIKIVGELGFQKAKKPMLAMIKKRKYKDIHAELDYSLSKLYKKPSPKGDLEVKKNYWRRLATSELTI